MNEAAKETTGVILAALLVCVPGLAICAAGAVFSAYMEAAAYNRVTGKNVTTWDAIWVDLRIQSEAKP